MAVEKLEEQVATMRILILICLALSLTGCRKAPVPAPAPHVLGADYPVPQGPAGTCDGGTSPVCGTGQNAFPSHLQVNLSSKVDGGILGQLALSHMPPCDGGETYVTGDAGVVKCGASGGGGGSTYTGVSPIYVDASSSTIGIGTVSLEAGVSVTPKLQESRLWPCASTGQGIYNEGTGTMQCGALPLGTSAAVSGLLPIASGGTGAAMTCSGSQLVQASSSTVLTCNTMSGDGTMSAGVLTNSGLENGIVTAGPATGTLTCAQGATACGIVQASTANATGANLALTPQPSTNASGTSGNVMVNLTAPTGAGSEAAFNVTRAGLNVLTAGVYPGSPALGAVWLGNGYTINATNFSFLGSSSYSYFNSPGTSYFGINDSIQSMQTSAGFQFGAATTNFGGGTGVLGITNATTAPSSNISGGAIIYATGGAFAVYPSGVTFPQFAVSSTATSTAGYLAQAGAVPSTCTSGNYCTGGSTGDLYGRGGGSTVTETHIAPQGDAFSYLDYGTILRTGSIAATGGTGTVNWPVPIGYVCWMHIVVVGNFSSGASGTAADIYTVYRNSAGTVAKVGILGSAANPIQNVGVSGAVSDTHFNNASSGPIGTGSTAASGGNVQITVTNQASSTANAFEVFVDAKCSSG